MATTSDGHHVKRLEALLPTFAASTQRGRKKDWRRTLGRFTGDEIMKRIDKEALKYRREDRKKTRRTRVRARFAKS